MATKGLASPDPVYIFNLNLGFSLLPSLSPDVNQGLHPYCSLCLESSPTTQPHFLFFIFRCQLKCHFLRETSKLHWIPTYICSQSICFFDFIVESTVCKSKFFYVTILLISLIYPIDCKFQEEGDHVCFLHYYLWHLVDTHLGFSNIWPRFLKTVLHSNSISSIY